MVALVSLIVISFLFYLFYKMKQFRSNLPAERKWLSAKANIALGFFILLFGVNQLFIFKTTMTYVISAIFVMLGCINIFGGYRLFKFYLPIAVKEADEFEARS